MSLCPRPPARSRVQGWVRSVPLLRLRGVFSASLVVGCLRCVAVGSPRSAQLTAPLPLRLRRPRPRPRIRPRRRTTGPRRRPRASGRGCGRHVDPYRQRRSRRCVRTWPPPLLDTPAAPPAHRPPSPGTMTAENLSFFVSSAPTAPPPSPAQWAGAAATPNVELSRRLSVWRAARQLAGPRRCVSAPYRPPPYLDRSPRPPASQAQASLLVLRRQRRGRRARCCRPTILIGCGTAESVVRRPDSPSSCL